MLTYLRYVDSFQGIAGDISSRPWGVCTWLSLIAPNCFIHYLPQTGFSQLLVKKHQVRHIKCIIQGDFFYCMDDIVSVKHEKITHQKPQLLFLQFTNNMALGIQTYIN